MTTADCGVPCVAVIDAGAADVFVREKPAGVGIPATVAFTAYDPAMVFAEKVDAAAMPLALVVVENVVEPLAKVPLAPEDGAVNVTLTFGTGFAKASRTVA